ncbi:MAG: hypothetical protein Q9195_009377 [Heterodermia aff. obscurata]
MALSASSLIPSFGFALDIDGTLLRGSRLLPDTTSTLLKLQQDNIPFILLTNSGGELEVSKAEKLCELLGVSVSPNQVVLGHTPFAALVNGHEKLRNEPVLVVGGGLNGEGPRTIAQSYGFENVFTPADVLAAYPAIWPNSHSYTATGVRQLPESLKFRAILVFNNPLDWGPALQIIIELLLSKDGQLGTQSPKNGDSELPNSGYLQDHQPKLYFSGCDLSWNSEYPVPRIGLGSFRAALEGIWKAFAGHDAELNAVELGKPSPTTFAFAETALETWRREMHLLEKDQELPPLKKVFMVGDSLATDIRGANAFLSAQGTTWDSILVKTGIWDGKGKILYIPTAVVEGIKEAVEYARKHCGE